MKINVKKLPKSEVEIEGEIEAELFESYYKKALNKIGKDLEIDGFRKGKVPENILVQKVPEAHILEEMAEMALSEHYPKIIEEEKIDAISRPEISITKLARNNPLCFKIKTAVMPEIELPNYKEVAKKTTSEISEKDKNLEVTDEEIENTILDIRKSRAPRKDIKEVAEESANKEIKEEHEHKEGGEEHEHKHEHEHKNEKEEELSLPEMNDDFVRSLGPFENVEDFKKKLKENLKLEKENNLKEKTRLTIMEKIMDETKTEIPEIFVESELNKIIYKMESDISAMGLKFEDYLKHINKTMEDLRKEFHADALKRAKLSLVLSKIAETEKLYPEEAEIKKEVEMILQHYKDADPERAKLHVENVLTNEKVFQFLENQN